MGTAQPPFLCTVGATFTGGKKKTRALTNQSPRLIEKLRMGTTSLPLSPNRNSMQMDSFHLRVQVQHHCLSRYLIHGNNNHEFVITKTYARNQRVYRLILLRHSNPTYIFSTTSRSVRAAQVQEQEHSATTLVTYWSYCAACFGSCTQQKKSY